MSALDPLRRLLPAALKRRLKLAFRMPLTRLHPDWSILRPIGPIEATHVVLDVGAHGGWFLHCWKDWCPSATIFGFEPALEAFNQAVRNYGSQPGIQLVNAGVGAVRGSLSLNLLSDSAVSNSFLAPDQTTWKTIDYHTGTITSREVEVITLDDFAREKSLSSVHLIKIDVQGFELEVLKGAARLLETTDHVLVESAIQPLYEGAPKFSAVFDFMDSHGFHLMDLRAWHRGNRVLIESDLLFRRNDLMPPPDSTVGRIYIGSAS